MSVEKAGASTYRMGIRNAVRGLWSGAMEMGQFYDLMGLTIDQGLTAAWAEGAKECGIRPGEYSDQEMQELNNAKAREEMYVPDLADAVQENSKANGGKLSPLFQRADAWIIRYQDVVNRARVMACSDRKYEWVLGPTEHCDTCARLEGQVRRGSFWREHVMPQQPPNPKLQCGGWRCQCDLRETDASVSRGRLPRTP